MSRLIDELVSEQRFAETLKFVEPHLPLIGRAARRTLPLQRLHDRIARLKATGGYSIVGFLAEAREHARSRSRLRRLVDKLQHWFGHLAILVPAQRKAEAAANDIARVLFRSADLRHFMVRMRPYFATELLRVDVQDKYDFSDLTSAI
jgi:hypothetical protein